MVGVIATIVQYTILIALVEILSVDPVAASVSGYMPSAVVNYALNYRYSFRSSAAHGKAFPKFIFVSGVGLVLNGALMALWVRGFSLDYLMAQIATTGIVLFWSFAANRVWSFAPDRSKPQGT
jgi:putative flippase GtrA